MNSISWELLRCFLAVARYGSVSAAAKQLDMSQPTLSRQIQALESQTGLQLFARTTQGAVLTAAGQKLVESAQKMESAAEEFQRQVQGQSTELEGVVRISANEIVGVYLLPAALTAFRRIHPGVEVELVIYNHASNLNKRDADIALRMFRPTQPELVAKRLPDMQLGFFASKDYVAEFGEPANIDELIQHQLIGFDRDTLMLDDAREIGLSLSPADFVLRTDTLLAQIQLARAGAGIVGTHVALANRWPQLQPVMSWLPLPPLEFWLVCHSDTQFNSRIRTLMTFLSEWFEGDAYHGLLL